MGICASLALVKARRRTRGCKMEEVQIGRNERRRLRGAGVGAKTVTDRAKDGPFGKTFLYEQIGLGRLRARKAGRATIILDEDWRDFLESLPMVGAAA